MEEQNINGIEDLLLRYCEGDVTEEEYQLVENWVNASEENERVAKQVFSIHLAIDSVQILKKIDTEKALKKVSSRIVAKKRQIGWGMAPACCCHFIYSFACVFSDATFLYSRY